MNNQQVITWIKDNRTTIITAVIFMVLGLIALNQLISIYAKADLLLNSCELCEKMGNTCSHVFKINFSNLTFNN